MDCKQYILDDEYADFIFRSSNDDQRLKEIYHATCVQNIYSQYVVIYKPIMQMQSIGEYGYQAIPKIYGLMDAKNSTNVGDSISKIHKHPGLMLQGEGTLIGIIDTGIDYLHNAFKSIDGATRIAAIWDQTIQIGKAPFDLGYGSEYSSIEINQAIKSDNPLSIVPSMDENGHGTFMAGIAAGNEDQEQKFLGVAPKSMLAIVKLKQAKTYLRKYYLVPDGVEAYQENDIMMAVYYLYQLANKLNKPISIFIGVGSSNGGHNGGSHLSDFISNIGNLNGTAFSIPCGNEGNQRGHFSTTFSMPEVSQRVEMHISEKTRGIYMEMWSKVPDLYSIDVIAPNGEHLGMLNPDFGNIQIKKFILEKASVYVQYDLVQNNYGEQVIVVRIEEPSDGLWTIDVKAVRQLYGIFNIWMSIQNFRNEATYFLKADPDITITTPGDTLSVLSIAAYDLLTQGIDFENSRGFLMDQRIAPDFAAPGVNIKGPMPQNKYTTKSGTSVAAAYCTGTSALLLQWGIINKNFINMNAWTIKSLCIRGTIREENIVYPNKIWGYGIFDLYQVFQYMIW